ncbi:MAG: hypothetical protein ABJO27_22800 [Pseudoruegeria sp.]
MPDITLTPATGIALLLIMIFAGRAFRENWKAQAPGWQRRAWGFGLPAALSFFALAFLQFSH